MKVKLENILEAIELASDAYEYFLNIETGETVAISDPIYTGIEDTELIEEIEENWESYYRLPTKFDVHEYSIMEEFVCVMPEGNMKAALIKAISGKGAFIRFKNHINRVGIEQKWYAHQAEAYRMIAIKWCEEHGLEYE